MVFQTFLHLVQAVILARWRAAAGMSPAIVAALIQELTLIARS